MKDFRIEFLTHEGYAFLAAEIAYREQRICQLFRRVEDDGIDIEILDERFELEESVLRFPLDDFLAVLDRTKAELLALRLDGMT
ncbi:MAG: hypothetical protein ACTHK2_01225 [Dokdonella sp.]|uniref:hypothetical protein n=1 Tax=Dokdonella sp. TaxID=2291710 RepID=UPI003F7D131B